ncbi:MAG: hypothetical protein R3E60_05680 [Alphaproteobacteria bacterium]
MSLDLNQLRTFRLHLERFRQMFRCLDYEILALSDNGFTATRSRGVQVKMISAKLSSSSSFTISTRLVLAETSAYLTGHPHERRIPREGCIQLHGITKIRSTVNDINTLISY